MSSKLKRYQRLLVSLEQILVSLGDLLVKQEQILVSLADLLVNDALSNKIEP
ncbi:hypothetical protein [Peribacillus frigoritolerans]|uniref:Uncharacterized protein n=1 Tax=Peribacillus frigoritolerans TaxID=450367 RepID=A0AAJ1QR87_9BACI|nr:hypothetical protein [Peribacillus frigoritolerans]MDM5285932.1 hypothetical protein [Peribacillus frigoritolerans]